MERLQPRPALAAPISALALAAGAAVSFGVGESIGFPSEAAESLFVPTWLLGLVLLVWAGIVGGGYVVLLCLRSLARRPVSSGEVVLAAVALGLVAVVLAAHPLWGTGSAVSS